MNWKIPPFSLFNRPFFCFLNEMGEVIFNNNKINSKKKNWKENQTRLLSDIACLFELIRKLLQVMGSLVEVEFLSSLGDVHHGTAFLGALLSAIISQYLFISLFSSGPHTSNFNNITITKEIESSIVHEIWLRNQSNEHPGTPSVLIMLIWKTLMLKCPINLLSLLNM